MDGLLFDYDQHHFQPDGIHHRHTFAFDRYGVRVPAVIVSPYMPSGSIIRSAPTGLSHQGPPYPFDHTSIIATVRKIFDLGGPLTARDAAAPDLLGPLSLEEPQNDGPANVTAIQVQPSREEIDKAANAPPNHLQEHLCRMAQHPSTSGLPITIPLAACSNT